MDKRIFMNRYILASLLAILMSIVSYEFFPLTSNTFVGSFFDFLLDIENIESYLIVTTLFLAAFAIRFFPNALEFSFPISLIFLIPAILIALRLTAGMLVGYLYYLANALSDEKIEQFISVESESLISWIITFLIIYWYIKSSLISVAQGSEALVERIGKYHRKLRPGLNFLVPVLDKVVHQGSVKEKLLLIDPVFAITKDMIKVNIEITLTYRVLELELTYYAIENHEDVLINFASAVIRADVGRIKLEEISEHENELIKSLLVEGDYITEPWGLKITTFRILSITVSEEYINEKKKFRAIEKEKEFLVLEGKGIAEFAILMKSYFPDISDKAIFSYLLVRSYSLNGKNKSEPSDLLEESTNSLSMIEFLSALNVDLENEVKQEGCNDFPSRIRLKE